MRFNHLLHLIATLAPRLDRGDSLGRRMGDLRHPVSSMQPRCRIPVRFPSSQTNFSPYIPLSAPPRNRRSSVMPRRLTGLFLVLAVVALGTLFSGVPAALAQSTAPDASAAPTFGTPPASSLAVMWTEPSNTGGSAITGYYLQYRVAGSGAAFTNGPEGLNALKPAAAKRRKDATGKPIQPWSDGV